MSLVSDLEQLQELPPPPLPSFWPQTWGWILVFVLLLLSFIFALLRWRKHRKNNAYRQAALAELNSLEAHWRLNPGNPAPLRDIPELLKRAVLHCPGEVSQDLARTGGRDWQSQLQRRSDITLSRTFAESLADLAYASDETLAHLDTEALIAECRQWLETHHDPV